jgi:hypothetical protein
VETADAKSSGASLSTDAKKGGLPPLRRYAMPALLFLYTVCIFVPWNLSPPPDDLDASWNAALHWAHVHHVDFGHDFVFTYGPWGFVMLRYLPATFGWVVAAWSFLGLAFFCATWKIFGALPSKIWAAGLAAVFITIAAAPIRQFQDVRMATVCWMLLPLYFYFDDSPWEIVKIIVVAAMAWASLIKFSFIFLGLPALAVVSLDQLSRRKIPSYLIVFVAAYLTLWVLAGQPIGSLGAYFSHSMSIASGYTEGEQEITVSEDMDVLLYLSVGALALVVAAMMHPWYRYRSERSLRRVIDETLVAAPDRGGTIEHRKSLLAKAGILGLLFLLFKAGYVRHDQHEIIATASLALLTIVLGATVWPRVHEIAAKLFIVLACAGALGLAWYSEDTCLGESVPGLAKKGLEELPDSISTALDWMSGGSGIRLQYERQRAVLPVGLASEIVGSVDSYSTGQRALIDNNLDYSPRPVIQSYLTYNSALSKLNADFLAGPRAPQTILFGVEPIDGHYPSQDDALSIPEILSRYDLKDASGPRLVLRRADQPRGFSLIPLGNRAALLREVVPVPASDDPIWVVIHLQLTPIGRLMRAVYKLPVTGLMVQTPSGRQIRHALLREEADSGFLLSPYLSDPVAMAMLYSPQWKTVLATDQIAGMAIGFVDDSADTYYQGEYSIEFYGLHFPQSDVSSVPGIADYVNLRKMAEEISELHSDGEVHLDTDTNGKAIIIAPALSQLKVPVPSGAKTFRFRFGMLDKSFAGDEKTEGVEFDIYAVDANLKGSRLWAQALDPAANTKDRGIHQAEVTLPPGGAADIVLQTVSASRRLNSNSYWTDLQFR